MGVSQCLRETVAPSIEEREEIEKKTRKPKDGNTSDRRAMQRGDKPSTSLFTQGRKTRSGEQKQKKRTLYPW